MSAVLTLLGLAVIVGVIWYAFIRKNDPDQDYDE